MVRKKPKESIRGDGQAGADEHPLVGIIIGSGCDWAPIKHPSRPVTGLGHPQSTLAAAILGAKHPVFREAFRRFRTEQTGRVLANPDPSVAAPQEKKGKRA